MSNRRIGEKYELERELARGGMGTIWVAQDLQLRRRVAVKLMSARLLAVDGARARFEREAMLVAQLQSPHVIQVYDYGVDGDVPYIVMELLDGEDLAGRLSRERQLSPRAVSQLLASVAKALGSAHVAGIVHRDLKPANLFLARQETEEIVKVLDFGIADMMSGLDRAAVAPSPTGARILLGTPHFMSPEQLRDPDRLDHRIDLWALAVIAYRALTGQLPYASEKLLELIVQISSDPAPPPSLLAPELGTAFDAFFARALSRKVDARFQSARELAVAFAAVADAGRPLGTTPILIVDDEPDVQLLVRQRFRQEIRSRKYEFVFASDGLEALEALRARPDIDVVMTDINMPRMSGLALLAAAREQCPMVHVVVVSAYGDMANIREAMNRGAFDFLTKPIEFQDFERTLDKTIRQAREGRITQRTSEQNNFLRMCVSDGVAHRLVPMLKIGAVGTEVEDATVAFVSLHGFSPLVAGEQLAPATALRVLNANLEVILPELAAQGGELERLFGDEVLTLFRGPDHATRALNACLSVRSQLAMLSMRAGEGSPYAHGVSVGVASGPVMSAGVGSTSLSRFDYSVFGDAVKMAAALRGAALKNEILVEEGLASELESAFQCSFAGARALAPGADPVRAFNVKNGLLASSRAPSPAEATVTASSGPDAGWPGVVGAAEAGDAT